MIFAQRLHKYYLLALVTAMGLGLAFAIPVMAQTYQKAQSESHLLIPIVSSSGGNLMVDPQITPIRADFFSLICVYRRNLRIYFPPFAHMIGISTTIYHVAKSGDGTDGLSWATAFTDLQDALAAADSGDEIWVATGVYTPGLSQSDTFTLTAGVQLYGGFVGAETARDQRDWTANPTILSGDIDGNDITDATGVVTTTDHINGSNSYHVVWADGISASITETTTLDGFTITAGQAQGSSPDNDGGGFFCDSDGIGSECSPSLSNITFTGNWADNDGGAMFNYSSDDSVSSPSLSNVTFSGNGSGDDGGAMFNEGRYGGVSGPSLNNVIFTGNMAIDSGGAMYNYGAYWGESSPSLVNVVFSGNAAVDKGGALSNYSKYGGTSSPTLVNVTFSGNSATYGGAMASYSVSDGVSHPSLSNVTYTNNSALDEGGALFNSGDEGGETSLSLSNVILWGNTAVTGKQSFNITSTLSISYSLIQSSTNAIVSIGTGAVTYGANILTSDPLFVDADGADGIIGTLDDDLRLDEGSSAIDAGDNDAISEITDLDGNDRFYDNTDVADTGNGTAPIVDMGAYEKQGDSSVILYLPIILNP